MMENEDSTPLYELRFDAAVKVIQSLPPDGSFQPSNDMMLKFYSYYKQATLGPCNIPRPGFWDPVGKVKWDAWNDLGDMSKEEAMTAYVEEMKKILEGMPCTSEVEQLLKVLGPFYEQVEENKKINQVSDLSAGFGTMLSSKSVTKSIIRTMEMNGTLETRPPRQGVNVAEPNVFALKEHSEEEEFRFDEEDDMEEEEEEEPSEKNARKASATKPKKKSSSGRPEVNRTVGNGLGLLSNGSLSSKSSLNSEDPVEGLTNHPLPLDPPVQVNGHHADLDGFGLQHAANDSDSEVYCDSMDQFGLEEGSAGHTDRCLELDEEEQGEERENHSPLSDQEGPAEAPCGTPDDTQGPPPGVQCGGEDGASGGGVSERRRLNNDKPRSSLVRRERSSRSSGHDPGASGPLQCSGGDGGSWREAGAPGGSLNEHIVVALARLQEDMQSVLERLHTLEALTASQAKSLSLPYPPSPLAQKSRKKPTWWPFEVSPGTVAFAVLWPFVVQWLIRQFLQRRRRRIN
ncbi:acyl-CoA-binding domain-containing protein 5A isoform X2 [Esox lucius]|uniref:acyl-CoA-binding domain-containing protein 5A isoform X2 n=1 Tax=Esox lucius TaxID=8010 RepID=UPI00147714D3|nr:acyl-CoA-binding domain-containing protein 5A isoform X2 [Esox lucius]